MALKFFKAKWQFFLWHLSVHLSVICEYTFWHYLTYVLIYMTQIPLVKICLETQKQVTLTPYQPKFILWCKPCGNMYVYFSVHKDLNFTKDLDLLWGHWWKFKFRLTWWNILVLSKANLEVSYPWKSREVILIKLNDTNTRDFVTCEMQIVSLRINVIMFHYSMGEC